MALSDWANETTTGRSVLQQAIPFGASATTGYAAYNSSADCEESCCEALSRIVAVGSFGGAPEREAVLRCLEFAGEDDPAGVYRLVSNVNKRLAARQIGLLLTLERDGDEDCSGGAINLVSTASVKFVDEFTFKLDFETGKRITSSPRAAN